MIEDIRPSQNPDCGCEEIECLIWPFDTVLHLEPDGTGDAFFYDGDREIEKNFPALTMAELIESAKNFVSKLHIENYEDNNVIIMSN